jgi:hypothetical protein
MSDEEVSPQHKHEEKLRKQAKEAFANKGKTEVIDVKIEHAYSSTGRQKWRKQVTIKSYFSKTKFIPKTYSYPISKQEFLKLDDLTPKELVEYENKLREKRENKRKAPSKKKKKAS